ncbi:MAG: sodium ion-translocating decarboxylase subunit beta [Fibrobacterales bacterium]
MKLLTTLMTLMLLLSGTASATEYFTTDDDVTILTAPFDLTINKVSVKNGKELAVGAFIFDNQFIAKFKDSEGLKTILTSGASGKITYVSDLFKKHATVPAGTKLLEITKTAIMVDAASDKKPQASLSFSKMIENLGKSTGIYSITANNGFDWTDGLGRIMMIMIGMLLLYLGITKGFEPLLLIPIGTGSILANIPLAFINDEGGILHFIYEAGITTGIFPLIIFMGVGAMTDFGPMLANPKTLLLGAAAQFGIFSTLIGALVLSQYVPGIDFNFQDASSIAIIGGADGPTSIFVASKLSPRLLGSIAVAAYSYMALVPIIQPPIMKLLTTPAERKIKMTQLRYVSKREKIIFPVIVIIMCAMLLPSAAPLIGFFMFGNIMKECGVVERLSNTVQNSLINIVTIFLGLGVGSKLSADKFLNLETLGIIILGLIAFSFGTAAGVIMARAINFFSKQKINPLIGSAGVSAVPMAARVSNKVGLDEDPHNFLLMHAMGPNVAGVVGSAVAAGVLLAVFQ